jgi:hypothetical protein
MIIEIDCDFYRSFSDVELFANLNLQMLSYFESITNENIINITEYPLENLVDLNTSFLEIDENTRDNIDRTEKIKNKLICQTTSRKSGIKIRNKFTKKAQYKNAKR